MVAARLIVVCAMLLVACSGTGVVWAPDGTTGEPTGPDGGGATDAMDAVIYGQLVFDVQPLDRPDAWDIPAVDGTPADCSADRDCPHGQRCLQGHCAVDECLATETPCGTDVCQMQCVPVRDLCATVHCAADQTCFEGRCVTGCFPGSVRGRHVSRGAVLQRGDGHLRADPSVRCALCRRVRVSHRVSAAQPVRRRDLSRRPVVRQRIVRAQRLRGRDVPFGCIVH